MLIHRNVCSVVSRSHLPSVSLFLFTYYSADAIKYLKIRFFTRNARFYGGSCVSFSTYLLSWPFVPLSVFVLGHIITPFPTNSVLSIFFIQAHLPHFLLNLVPPSSLGPSGWSSAFRRVHMFLTIEFPSFLSMCPVQESLLSSLAKYGSVHSG